MTKLKTLKDMTEPCSKFPNCNGGCVVLDEEVLRQEAIKWIKYIQEDIDNATYWDAISYRKQEWIMTFFNLTEEDLK